MLAKKRITVNEEIKETEKLRNSVDIVVAVILDESREAANFIDENIATYNNYIRNLRSRYATGFKKRCVKFYLAKFNNVTRIVLNGVAISEVPELSKENYRPGGQTALYDAIADTVTHIDVTKQESDAVVLVIIANGEDNGSLFTDDERVSRILLYHSRINHWNIEYYENGRNVGSNCNLRKILFGIKARLNATPKRRPLSSSHLIQTRTILPAIKLNSNVVTDTSPIKDGKVFANDDNQRRNRADTCVHSNFKLFCRNLRSRFRSSSGSSETLKISTNKKNFCDEWSDHGCNKQLDENNNDEDHTDETHRDEKLAKESKTTRETKNDARKSRKLNKFRMDVNDIDDSDVDDKPLLLGNSK